MEAALDKSSIDKASKSNRVKWIENFYRMANGKKEIKDNGKTIILSIDDLKRLPLNK